MTTTLIETRTPESCLTWDDDCRLVPGSLNRAIKDYIEQHAKPPVRVYLHPINEKYAGEAGSIPVILRHGVLRNEVWFSLPDARPTETFPDAPQTPRKRLEKPLTPKQHKSPASGTILSAASIKDVLQAKNKPQNFETSPKLSIVAEAKPCVIMQPIMKHRKPGRPVKRGKVSRVTRWRREKRKQQAMQLRLEAEENNLSINGMIAQAKEAEKQIKEDIKKREKGGE